MSTKVQNIHGPARESAAFINSKLVKLQHHDMHVRLQVDNIQQQQRVENILKMLFFNLTYIINVYRYIIFLNECKYGNEYIKKSYKEFISFIVKYI